MVEGVCFLAALIGRFGRRGTAVVGMLIEVPAAAEHEFGPPEMQLESQAPPGLLEVDGLAPPVVDVEELEMPIGDLRGDQVDDAVECAGQLPVLRAGDEVADLPFGRHLSEMPLRRARDPRLRCTHRRGGRQ